jgi:predicted GNAT superfamily acetyltransferase
MGPLLEIRECTTIEELTQCVELQRAVFALPDLEISPVRHLVVTKNAGGFTFGAFSGSELVGFVLSVPAFLRDEKALYSHMTAVRADFQSHGIGAKLKWAQRTRALELGIKYVKWTFEPWKARNAYFNLEKLGAIVNEYQSNFYGVDYSSAAQENIGLKSDRLFAEWHLESDKVTALSEGSEFTEKRAVAVEIEVPTDWNGLVEKGATEALNVQHRLETEFTTAFRSGFVCRGFARDADRPRYLLFKD